MSANPVSVRWFSMTFVAATIAGLASNMIFYGERRKMFLPDEKAARAFGASFLFWTILFSIILPFLLWVFVMYRKSRAAYWLLAALTAYTLIVAPFPLFEIGLSMGRAWPVLGALSWMLQAVALYFLFRPSTRRWLAGIESEPRVDASVFE